MAVFLKTTIVFFVTDQTPRTSLGAFVKTFYNDKRQHFVVKQLDSVESTK
jgi:hypothetical protein